MRGVCLVASCLPSGLPRLVPPWEAATLAQRSPNRRAEPPANQANRCPNRRTARRTRCHPKPSTRLNDRRASCRGELAYRGCGARVRSIPMWFGTSRMEPEGKQLSEHDAFTQSL